MQTKDLKEIKKEFFKKFSIEGLCGWREDRSDSPCPYATKELWSWVDHAIQSAIDDKGKEIEKEIYKHYKDETVASGHRIWNEALDLSVSIVGRLSELSKKEE